MTLNAILAATLALLGMLFLLIAALFFVRREKACRLIAGFNSMTERQQAQYDQAAIARDYGRLFGCWAAGAFVFAALCLFFGWAPFAIAMALLLITLIPRMHLWAENAFKQYKIEK